MNIKMVPIAAVLLALGSTAALADSPIHEGRALNPDASVSIANVAGSVTVVGWDENRIEISGTLGEGARPLLVEGDAGKLKVKVEALKTGGWFSRSSMRPTVLDVRLPRGVRLDVDVISADTAVSGLDGGSLEVDSVSGKVEADVAVSKLDVESVSGAVQVRGSAELMEIETVSGDVDVLANASREVNLETISGDQRYEGGPVARLEAESVSGSLRLTTSLADAASVEIGSTSGDVTLSLPASASAELHAKTFSGDIRSFTGAVERARHGLGSSLTATLGGGSGRVRVETMSGDIRIKAGSPAGSVSNEPL